MARQFNAKYNAKLNEKINSKFHSGIDRKQIFIGSLLVCLGCSLNSRAAMPEGLYKAALQVAQKKAFRKAQLDSNSGALSSTLIKSLLGRYYAVGDNWDVAAWQINHSGMRRLDDSKYLQDKVGTPGLFHYEVLSVKNGTNPEVVLQVTQKDAPGFSAPDPKVSELHLSMNDQLHQSEKTYFFKDQTEGVHVSPEGVHSKMTLLELFPLDVPEVTTADHQTRTALPELPPAVQNFTTKIGFKPDFSQSSWFEQDDFFGRTVQILWQHGNPWPSYLKTTNGIAILIHKESL